MPEIRDFLDTARLRAYQVAQHSGPMAAGVVGGTPIGIIAVWALEEFLLPRPMPAYVAVAVGSVVTAIVGRFAPAISRLLERGGKPHAKRN